MLPTGKRGYDLLAAAYFPALTLAVSALAWALGKPSEPRALLGLVVVTAVAGGAVGRLLRRQIIEAIGPKVLLVAILALVLGTPVVVLPELLFHVTGLLPRLGAGEAVLTLLVATLGTSFNPLLWLAASGWVLLLRRQARQAGPAAAPQPAPPAPQEREGA